MVNKVEHKSNKNSKASASSSKPAKECWRCGGDKHNANYCKVKSLKSFNCSKQGHSAKKCRSEKKKAIPVVETSFLGIPSSNVGYSDEDLHTIFTCGGDARATLQETVSVNGVPLTMEIDSGAVVSVVGNVFYEKYLPHVPYLHFQSNFILILVRFLQLREKFWLMLMLMLKVKRLNYPWLLLTEMDQL